MEKKIVILFEVHPVITYARRYDYQSLIDAGYQIEICDMANVLLKDKRPNESCLESSEQIKYTTVGNKREFIDYIAKLDKNTFIWSTFQLTAEYYWVFRAVSKHFYGFICNVDYVFPRSSALNRGKAYWTNLSWHRISNALLYRIPRRFLPIKKADAVITYGADDIERKLRNVLYDCHTAVELTNTIDYNECIKVLNAENSDLGLPEKYIVFIDDYIPYHRDAIELGLQVDPDRYYSEIEGFLHRVSKYLNMPVIIAAHPSADYKLHSECYKGMRIIQFKTAELVKNADFVITHLSIAIGMILISRKAYMVVTTDDIERVVYNDGITGDQERDIDRKVINISENKSDSELEEEINKALKSDDQYYDRQIAKYRLPAGHPNEKLSFGQIIVKATEEVIGQQTG